MVLGWRWTITDPLSMLTISKKNLRELLQDLIYHHSAKSALARILRTLISLKEIGLKIETDTI